MRILVVEDEAAIADFLRRGLEAEGYRVVCAADGLEGQRIALGGDVDLVILDRMLPKLDGLELLDSVHSEKPGLPVILLTARDEISERVQGLDRGATDYMTKPFSFEELAARVRARLRQTDGADGTRLEAGDIRIELLSREVTRQGRPVVLSAREFELLVFLARHAGHVCRHEDILAAVWGYDHDPGTNVVQVYIGYLRRHLSQPDQPAPIETVRSVGYRLLA
jgi:DNA-binding response OmpR family regulator